MPPLRRKWRWTGSEMNADLVPGGLDGRDLLTVTAEECGCHKACDPAELPERGSWQQSFVSE
jgi:hypothetical protein